MSKDNGTYLRNLAAAAEATRVESQASADRAAAEVARLLKMASEEEAEGDDGPIAPAEPPAPVDPAPVPGPVQEPPPVQPAKRVFGTFARPGNARSPFNVRPVAAELGTTSLAPSPRGWLPVIAAGNLSTKVFKVDGTEGPMRVEHWAGGQLYLSDPQSMQDHVDFAHWPIKDQADLGTAPTEANGPRDGHADLVDPARNVLTSFYNLREDGGVFSAQVIAPVPLDGSLCEAGPRAVQIPSCAGLIRRAELASLDGIFPHALAMTLAGESLGKTVLAPATGVDGDASINAGSIPYFALMMLPSTFPIDQIKNPMIAKVARTLMPGGYGARVVDKNTATPFVILIEIARDGDPATTVLDTDATDLQLMAAQLRQVEHVAEWIDGNGIVFESPYPLRVVASVDSGKKLTRDRLEAISRLHYGFRACRENDLARMAQSFPEGSPGDQGIGWTGTGYADGIGLLTMAASMFMISPEDPRAIANLIANARTSTAFPVHLGDPVTGNGPIRFDLNPTISAQSSNAADHNWLDDPHYKIQPGEIDIAHQRHWLYPAAIYAGETGDAALLDFVLTEMKYWCAWNYIMLPADGRQGSKGLFLPFFSTSGRAAAWGLACLAQTVHALTLYRPTDAHLPSLRHSLEENIKFLDGTYRTGLFDTTQLGQYYSKPIGWWKNDEGLTCALPEPHPEGYSTIKGWMQGFQAATYLWIVAIADDLKLSTEVAAILPAFRDFGGKWIVSMFGPANDPAAWDWRRAGTYEMVVGKYVGDTFQFFTAAERYQAQYGTFPPLGDRKAFYYHDSPNQLDALPTGYVDNIVPALSLAVQTGVPGAVDAMARAVTAEQWAGGGTYQFGILPPGQFFDQSLATPPAASPPAPTASPPPAPQPAPAPAVPVGMDATTKVLTDTLDLSKSVHGSVESCPRPTDYVHTLASPAGFKPLGTRTPVALPDGSGWRVIPGSELLPHMTPPIAGGSLASVFGNWTGGCPIPALQLTVYPPGGGHSGNNNSTFYYFDWITKRSGEFYPPSPIVSKDPGADQFPSSEYPQAVHWYGTPVPVLDKRDGHWKCAVVGTSATVNLWLFDPIAGTIEKMSPYVDHAFLVKAFDYRNAAGNPQESASEGLTGLHGCYDPKRNILFFHNANGNAQVLSHFEVDRNQWFKHGSANQYQGYYGIPGRDWNPAAPNDNYAHMQVDPVNDRLVVMSRGMGIGYLPLSLLATQPDCDTNLNLADLSAFSNALSFAWDEKRQDWVIYDVDPANASQGKLWRADPLTYAVTEIPNGAGGPPPNPQGTWGRFWYNAAAEEFQTVSEVAKPVWTFKRSDRTGSF